MRLLLAASSFALVLSIAPLSRAQQDDCPPGSFQKSEEGFTWCQPSVCTNDSQCKPNEVCRNVALCMEVGSLADAGSSNGSKRLAVTQRCAAEETCPQKQTCSKLDRCVSKAAAEKMGILTAASSSATPAGGEPAKKSCGCRAVGSETTNLGAFAAMLGVAMVLVRRRVRK